METERFKAYKEECNRDVDQVLKQQDAFRDEIYAKWKALQQRVSRESPIDLVKERRSITSDVSVLWISVNDRILRPCLFPEIPGGCSLLDVIVFFYFLHFI